MVEGLGRSDLLGRRHAWHARRERLKMGDATSIGETIMEKAGSVRRPKK